MQLVVILNGLLRLSAAAVVIGQSFPATALSVVEFREKMESATLLAEALSQPGGEDCRGFGVELADLVAAVVMLGVGEIGITALGLTPRRVRQTGFRRSRPPLVQPVHEVVLGGEIRSAPQIQPNSRREIRRRHHLLALRHHHKPGPPAGGRPGHRLKRQHRRRGGLVRVVGAWVVEGVNMSGLRLALVVEEGGRRSDESVGEGLVVVVEYLAGLVRILRGLVSGEHDRRWVPPFVLQHFPLKLRFDDVVPKALNSI